MNPRADRSLTQAPLPVPRTKLPTVGTTIFTVMSALAVEHDAVNLGQGFPDFQCDPALVDAVTAAMRAGHNQYPPMAGVLALRERITEKIEALYQHRYDPQTELTVTAGATQAIMTAILALVHPGDEVIVIEPVYDSYVPSIRLAGGTAVPVRMTAPVGAGENFSVPWDEIERAITPKTRLLIVNSPHNPTGSVFQEHDLRALEKIVVENGLFLISDEVYEHMVFDGRSHLSVARYPDLAQRSVVVSSFGKTYHVTGWKVAYAAAPAALTAEFRKVHQFNVFTVNTPMQHALAAYMADPLPYLGLSAFYEAKRDYFLRGLANTRFAPITCAGTYFQLARFGAIDTGQGPLNESDFCQWLTREARVAAIPVSAFYETPVESGVVRFCFAKTEATLDRALARLATL